MKKIFVPWVDYVPQVGDIMIENTIFTVDGDKFDFELNPDGSFPKWITRSNYDPELDD